MSVNIAPAWNVILVGVLTRFRELLQTVGKQLTADAQRRIRESIQRMHVPQERATFYGSARNLIVGLQQAGIQGFEPGTLLRLGTDVTAHQYLLQFGILPAIATSAVHLEATKYVTFVCDSLNVILGKVSQGVAVDAVCQDAMNFMQTLVEVTAEVAAVAIAAADKRIGVVLNLLAVAPESTMFHAKFLEFMTTKVALNGELVSAADLCTENENAMLEFLFAGFSAQMASVGIDPDMLAYIISLGHESNVFNTLTSNIKMLWLPLMAVNASPEIGERAQNATSHIFQMMAQSGETSLAAAMHPSIMRQAMNHIVGEQVMAALPADKLDALLSLAPGIAQQIQGLVATGAPDAETNAAASSGPVPAVFDGLSRR